MEIQFRLGWVKSGKPAHKAFKLPAAHALMLEYVGRISKFDPCQISNAITPEERKRPGTKIWICDRNQGAQALSSKALAGKLEKFRDSGMRELVIAIGGPDGFSKEELERLKPDLKWSFGPMTLPHELAAVVAAEQIYRAWTIMRRTPYHLGH